MEQNALVVDGLTKQYRDFTLDHISFCVPRGSIVGLIGENGAGKSTAIQAILGLIQKDAGSISLLGKTEEEMDAATRNRIGVVFDGSTFPGALSPDKLNTVFQRIYETWDEDVYFSLLEQLSLPKEKKFKEFSKGMRMKLSIAVALSHHSEFLILDEATSGLDPVVRDDILDIFLDFVQDENHSILVSSHITSDLEKVADYIVFLHEGKIIFSKSKDELIYRYGIIKCGAAQFAAIDQQDIVAWRKQDYEWDILVADRDAAGKKYPKTIIDPATIDDIMLFYGKGERP